MIGQDTEFFAFDIKQNKVVPAHSIGIKKEKTTIEWSGSFFRDGYAVEVNTSPATCRAGIWEQMGRLLNTMKGNLHIPAHIKLITDPCASIDLEELKSAPADLHVLGCNPTLDAYKEREKLVEVDPMALPFRTTGGHMHFSFNRKEVYTKPQLAIFAKYCDLAIGLPFTIIYGDDKEFMRRTLYGQAGEFREQHYPGDGYYDYEARKNVKNNIQGFEYRVLSSRLYNHPGIFGLFMGVFKYFLENRAGLLAAGWNSKLDEPLQKAINEGIGATELLEEFGKAMKRFLTVDPEGMHGVGYIPKDWGAAMLKLRKMREETESPLNRFLMWEGQQQGHWGWSEYNDHNMINGKAPSNKNARNIMDGRSSTIGHRPLVEEKPWLL